MELVQEQSSVHGEPEPADYSAEMTAHFGEDDDDNLESASSTPYASAPSSPGRGRGYFFFSAPASPMHFVLCSAPSSAARLPAERPRYDGSPPSEFAFDFSSPFPISASIGAGTMTSAEELFLNGQIRPKKLSPHLHRPQALAPPLDPEGEEDEVGNDGDCGVETTPSDGTFQRGRDLKVPSGSVHRKARSLSPLRDAAFEWNEEGQCTGKREVSECVRKLQEEYDETKQNESAASIETTASFSASSSRSSSSGRNSKKWIFLKDLLHRSKSEGRGNGKDKFWTSISFSPSKEKKLRSEDNNKAGIETQKPKQYAAVKTPSSKAVKPTNGVANLRAPAPSAHELLYTANRAQAEEMKKRTYLPYRHGLFGCLGFSSKGYNALNGLARSLNPVASSR